MTAYESGRSKGFKLDGLRALNQKINSPGIDKLIIRLLPFQIGVSDGNESSVGLLNDLNSLLVEIRKQIFSSIERLIQ